MQIHTHLAVGLLFSYRTEEGGIKELTQMVLNHCVNRFSICVICVIVNCRATIIMLCV